MGLDRDKLRRSFRRQETAAEAAGTTLPAVPRDSGTASEAGAAAAELLGYLQRRLRATRPRIELPPGEVLATPHGALWRRELRYPLSWVHGAVRLWPANALDGQRLASLAKDAAFAALDPRHCLFLDTETTGLSGGAGTVVFAYGLGRIEADEFVLEQTFLRDFGEELAMLHHLAARLASHPVLVTFVGKSYDRHRIHARLALHKLSVPVLSLQHLDLYHLVRRAYGKQLPNVRLRTVEERLLGLQRHEDLPGSEAPAEYFAWLRDRSGAVDRVLEHNRLDVLSLCALLGRLVGPGAD
jgi:uncharacterized protein YprB with RNaseH-like and TPR domain